MKEKKLTDEKWYNSRLYKVYMSMIHRCYYSKQPNYKNYGGRGIKVCDDWKNDYKVFEEWAIKSGYNPNAKYGECTLDRIDFNGNYEPSNCRWITRNTRKNKIVEFNGESYTIAEWSEKLGIPYSRIYNRLYNGWSVEKALSTPVNAKHINKKYLKELQNG